MNYNDELIRAMIWLSEKLDTIFIGQDVCYPGGPCYKTLVCVPEYKKIEFPIAEDFQMGVSIGLSLMGYMPISVYPRCDFLILACNQLANHLDKIEEISCEQYRPKVIIRATIGSKTPLDPGPQHTSDYSNALKAMLKNIDVVRLEFAEQIFPGYQRAYESDRSTILIEVPQEDSNGLRS